MPQHILKRIFRLLESKIGHNVSALHEDVWLRALEERIAVTHCKDSSEYYELIITHPTEFQEFVELIVVPETWFFRDRVSLDFIVNYCKEKWIRHNTAVRILCAPCSTGEEPYSLAMLFHENNIASKYYSIDAVDISKKALIQANLAIYGKHSFRGKDITYRETYFMKSENGLELLPQIRQQVHLAYGNLSDPGFFEERPPYHVIICRNLLIYLNAFSQKLLMQNFKKIMLKNGILVVSPSESEIARKEGFVPLEHRKYCAFMRPEGMKPKVLVQDVQGESLKADSLDLGALSDTTKKNHDAQLLIEAQNMADHGEFQHALDNCFAFLKKVGPHAETFFLIGVIELALGNDSEAETYFTKTIELDSKNAKALVYLSLIADTKGDREASAKYQQRAKKLTE